MKRSTTMSALVEGFFRDYLLATRGASPHTVRAYRDTVKLLLLFIADRRARDVADLTLDDLTVEAILAFLSHLESTRANAIASRNARLAAIHSFVRHLLRHDPTRAEQYQRILAVPAKRARVPLAHYLEPEVVRLILAQPDRQTAMGRRDYALMLFLYNVGARVSEALGVRVEHVNLQPPRQVSLRGKGNKRRICPLWSETSAALSQILAKRGGTDTTYVFLNRDGQPLTRDGVAYILQKYATRAAVSAPALRRQRVTPHVLRHSCAVALLQSGVDVTVIRDYLGHASIATTSRYIATNLQMKREALERFWTQSGLQHDGARAWKPTTGVMAFLTSL